MSPRALTAPPDDRSMWRQMVARCHPDAGGDHELFIWATATRDHVIGGELGEEIPRRPGSSSQRSYPASGEASSPDRLDYSAAFDKARDFSHLTALALERAGGVGEPYGAILALLADCYEAGAADPPLYRQQHQGATYRTLAAIAHRAGMSKAQRLEWYRVAESVPLSQRHAGHIMSKLQRMAA